MKKWIFFIIAILLAILAIIVYKYNTYNSEIQKIKRLNKEFETFIDGEITGTSLITLINKSVDLNKKNNIGLDSKNHYIDNGRNSIIIEIKFLDSEDIFRMEQINSLGSGIFIKNYAAETFKCTKKEYHEKTNIIKYMLFEQI